MASPSFEESIAPHRAELHAHCYRMLGSLQDADDALQDALLGAWRGFDKLESQSALRAWLYRIATNACLQVIAKRPRRWVAAEYRRAASPDAELESMLSEAIWLEPYPCDPHASYEARQSVELAFVAALQHLPGTQRAVLLLSEVLGFAASEIAESLETSVASVNSALQRARESIAQRVPAKSQQATLRELGDEGQRELVARFVEAWGRSDVDGILQLLVEDARFTMPPIPSWFQGHHDIARFMRERMFVTRWRAVPVAGGVSGQLAFACYQGPDFRLGALNVVTLRGACIAEMTGFLDPALYVRFSLPDR